MLKLCTYVDTLGVWLIPYLERSRGLLRGYREESGGSTGVMEGGEVSWNGMGVVKVNQNGQDLEAYLP